MAGSALFMSFADALLLCSENLNSSCLIHSWLSGSHVYAVCVCVYLHAQLCPTICDPWNVACQAPLSMVFSRQEYWSSLPFSSAGDVPNPGIEPGSHAFQAGSFPFEPPGKLSLLRVLFFPPPFRNSLWSGWK